MKKVLKLIVILMFSLIVFGCFSDKKTETGNEDVSEISSEFLIKSGEIFEKSEVLRSGVPAAITKDVCTWIWDTSTILDTTALISKITSKKIKTVYLQINYDISAADYRKFIAAATLNNISVHALGGAPSWALTKNAAKYNAFFSWIGNYQSRSLANEKFTGIHCDVEPYALAEWKSKYQSTVQQFQAFVISAQNSSKNLGLELTLDIPFWFDGQTFKNSVYGNGILSEWIIKSVDRISIMAYRDTALGSGGIIAVVDSEIKGCKANNKKLTISVETLDVAPVYITFFQETDEYMFNELATVQSAYTDYDCFDSFGIHEYMNRF